MQRRGRERGMARGNERKRGMGRGRGNRRRREMGRGRGKRRRQSGGNFHLGCCSLCSQTLLEKSCK